MRFSLGANVDLSGLERFTSNLEPRLSQAVRQTAFSIEHDAKVAAPVDTGALRASIYTSTQDRSGYDNAALRAVSRGANDRVTQVVEEVPQPQDPLSAIVAVGVSYGSYVEFGTARMPAQPFLGPAAEMNRSFFSELVRDALRDAGRSGGSVAPALDTLEKGSQPGPKEWGKDG